MLMILERLMSRF